MASNSASRQRISLDDLFGSAAPIWLAGFALAMPWLRFEVGAWVLYPGQLAVGLLLAAMLLDEGGWARAARALLPALALGAYIAAMAALRGQWLGALLSVSVTLSHFWWGAAAYRFGLGAWASRAAQEALIGLLAAALAFGLLGWALQALWPAGCRAFNCDPSALWPYPFAGGWSSPDHYLVFLLFLLPVVAGPLVQAMREPRTLRRRPLLVGLCAAAGFGWVAGASLWAGLVVLLGMALLTRVLSPRRWDGDRLLLGGLAFGFLLAVVFVYGLAPGYLGRLISGGAPPAPLRVILADPAPRALSSLETTSLRVSLLNTGWQSVGRNGEGPLTIAARLMVTPQRGLTRAYDAQRVTVPAGIAPGQTRTAWLHLRLPHWVKEGYLAWRIEDSRGRSLPLAKGSHPGFRFVNAGFRRLSHDPENRLSPLAERARAYRRETYPPIQPTVDSNGAERIVGEVLDTLFFSPLWGEAPSGSAGVSPLAAGRPFLPALFHRYGLIGVLLAGWFGWRLFDRAIRSANRASPAWQLVPVALLLLGTAALFSAAPGSYHALWAFFLLSGYVEGRHARTSSRIATESAPGRSRRFPFPRPWRMGALLRGDAGRIRRR